MSSLRFLMRQGLQLRHVCAARIQISQQFLLTRTTLQHQGIPTVTRFLSTTGIKDSKISFKEACNILQIEQGSPNMYVVLKGLPYRTTNQQILKFLEGIEVEGGEKGIIGEYFGMVWVRVNSVEDVQKAVEKNGEKMAHNNRYIQVEQAKQLIKPAEYKAAEKALGVDSSKNSSDIFLKISNLPYGTSAEEVRQLFKDINIEQGGALDGLMEAKTGQAFVKLKSEEDLEKVFDNEWNFGGRNIRVARVSYKSLVVKKIEMDGGYYRIRMTGIPYDATVHAIANFLGRDIRINGGLRGITLVADKGLAFVDLDSEDDYKAALSKDREYMGYRYIDIRPAFNNQNQSNREPKQIDEEN